MNVFILIGDIFEGFTAIGPFNSRDEALAFANADEELQLERWSVVTFDAANDNVAE